MARKKANYDILATTYLKKPTGRKNKYGNREYETIKSATQTKRLKNTNFGNLKKDLYNSSMRNKNLYVNYSRPTYTINKISPRLKSSVKTAGDGTRTVTYYKAVKKAIK